jgi:flavin-dependent dehydrogenase
MIQKPKLLMEMRGSATVRFDPVDIDAYDVVVDCTGAARALLPPSHDDLISPTLQYRIRRDVPSAMEHLPVIRFIKIGYAWSFPLDNNHFHIGVGSLVEELVPSLHRTGLLHPDDALICQCMGKVRVGTPDRTLPIHRGNVWGVGECIGTVSPLVGDGIMPSMQCASLFAEHLSEGTLDQYQNHVLTEFSWMAEERRVIDRVIAHGGRVGLGDLLVMRSHAHRFGFRLGTKWIISRLAGRQRRKKIT